MPGHLSHLWGLPYRIAVTLIGLITALLAITGIYIWWKKRCGRTLPKSL